MRPTGDARRRSVWSAHVTLTCISRGLLARSADAVVMPIVRRVAPLALVFVIVACSVVSPAELIFHNRSDVPIALYPDVTVPPCSTIELNQAAIDAGKARFDAAFASGDFDGAWVPAGAVQFLTGVPPRRIGEIEPVTVVVSGVAEPRFVLGRVPEVELPPCGGQPVGIS